MDVTIYVVTESEIDFCSSYDIVVCSYTKDDGTEVLGAVVDEYTTEFFSDHTQLTVTVNDSI